MSGVDVVILTWNDGEHLERAVLSALASTGTAVRVIVVDNGSDPPAVVPAVPSITLLRKAENSGVARGRNVGARAGSSPLVCFLDSDAVLYPETLTRLEAVLAEQPDVVLAAPVFTHQSPEASGGRAPTLSRKLRRVLNLTDTYEPTAVPGAAWWDVDFVIGACQLFRRDAFEAIGGLDETYFYGPEDVDFCLRLRRAGGRIVQVRDARCDHPPRRRFRKLLSRRGARHGWAVARHLWRHRWFTRRTAT